MPGIDFRAVRYGVPIREALALLGWRPRVIIGPYWRGGCPVHRSTDRTSRCFSVQTVFGLWFCHKCHAGGNVLDLYARVKALDLHAAARELCERTGRSVPWLRWRDKPAQACAALRAREQEEAPVSLRPGSFGPHGRRLTATGPTEQQRR